MSSIAPGFVRALFRGALDSASVLPYPHPDPETAELSREVADMTRDWAVNTIDPAAIDVAQEIPSDVLEGLAELGLLGLTYPEEFGGAGASQHTYASMMEAVAYRCPSTSTVLGAHLGLGTKGVLLFGTDEQKARWLPRLATGELLGSFALTEPQAGSDAAALTTTADREPDGSWRLNGSKVWITNGGLANFFTVFARTPHPEKPDAPVAERPISAFVVLTGESGGVTIGAEEHKMGLKGSSTTEVVFEDVVVPADNLLGPEGKGFRVALEILNGGRHSLAATCVGQAKLALELAVDHARERVQYKRPIGEFGMVKEMLAGMAADVYAMEAGTYLAAGLVDRQAGGREQSGKADYSLESACCKIFATEKLWTISNDALQVAGGTGFMKEYAFERIVRDARVNLIFEGTNQVLRMMLALRSLQALTQDGPEAGPGSLERVHPDFLEEAAFLAEAAGKLGERAGQVLANRGTDLRDAQHDQKRLADMAVALYTTAAVLSRATAALEGDDPAGPLTEPAQQRERDLARLAAKRLACDFRIADRAFDTGEDELVDRVADAL